MLYQLITNSSSSTRIIHSLAIAIQRFNVNYIGLTRFLYLLNSMIYYKMK